MKRDHKCPLCHKSFPPKVKKGSKDQWNGSGDEQQWKERGYPSLPIPSPLAEPRWNSRPNQFHLPAQRRDQIVPESPVNHPFSGHGESSPRAGRRKDNEVLAVQSRYTAYVGNQDLPESAQKLYRLIARVTDFASGSDEHPFAREEAINLFGYVSSSLLLSVSCCTTRLIVNRSVDYFKQEFKNIKKTPG